MQAPRRRSAGVVLLFLVSTALLTPPAWAAEAPEDAEPIESAVLRIGPPARILLSRLQVGWLAWLSSVNAADPDGARAAIGRIQAYAAQVGTPYLPELSLAASARALEAAEAGQFDRAGWALEAAEELDPGRAETAFAGATVARAEGSWLRWLASTTRGYVRTVADPFLGQALALSTLSWLHAVLLIALLAFAATQMAVKGGWLYRDLLRAFKRYLPAPLAHLAIWALLLWPLALPAGPLWLALSWGVLLWSHGRLLERCVLVLTWVVVAATPAVVSLQESRFELLTDSALGAVEAAADGRLYGSLLTEVARLETRLPESVALAHVVADLERRLGECEVARVFYARVLEVEPRNAAALADLGLCSYEAGSFERAIQYFQLAGESGRPRAEVEFNLSQAYSELYRFNEAESALRAARAVDSAAVNEWIQSGDPRLMIAVEGGLERTDEIARELRAGRPPARPWTRLAAPGRRLAVLAAVFVAIALVLRYALGVNARRPAHRTARWLPGVADLWRRVLLPGIAEGEVELWGRALLALVAVAALVSLPWADRLGFGMPWGIEPRSGVRTFVAGAGLALLLMSRFLTQRNLRL